LLAQQLTYLPAHRSPHLRQAGGFIASRISEGNERWGWEKERKKRRSVGLELKRLRLASTTIIVPKAMRE
jgi:hypothetical protein